MAAATEAAVDALISEVKEDVSSNPVKQAAAATFTPGAPTGEASKPPQSEEELQAAIKKQVEYYFSDANLASDKFLKVEMGKSEGKWIAISCIATFNRMKTLNPSLKTDVIASALDGSTVVELSEDKLKIRGVEKKYTLGGKEYRSRAPVIAHARSLLDGAADGDGDGAGDAAGDAAGVLSAEAQRFVLDLLEHHGKCAEKKGAGVASVKAGCNPEFPDTKCFVLVRTDQSEVDFSYIKCVDSIFPKDLPKHLTRSGSKRRAEGGGEPAAKRGPGAEEASNSMAWTKGCIVVVKALKEGQTIMSMKEAFAESGAVKFVELVPGKSHTQVPTRIFFYFSPPCTTPHASHPHLPPPCTHRMFENIECTSEVWEKGVCDIWEKWGWRERFVLLLPTSRPAARVRALCGAGECHQGAHCRRARRVVPPRGCG